jgi:hypothetical protein
MLLQALSGVGVGLGVGLSGCGLSTTLDMVRETVAGRRESSGYPLSAEQIHAMPYACLGVHTRGASAVMALANYDGEDLRWASADQVLFVTRRGRLIRTVGLERDLVYTQFAQPDPLGLPDFGAGRKAEVCRRIDLRPEDAYGVAVESSFEVQGAEVITILGRPFTTTRVREHLRVQRWRWSADNLFWVEADTGIVRRARQQYCPEVAAIEYEVLKLPAPPPSS